MLQLNDQHPAVHSIWVTKSRVIPTFPSFSTEFADPLIGDFRLIQVTNSEESTDEDLDVGDDNVIDAPAWIEVVDSVALVHGVRLIRDAEATGIGLSLNRVGLSTNSVGLSTKIRDRVYLASTRSRLPNNLFGSDLGIGNNGRNPPPIEQGR